MKAKTKETTAKTASSKKTTSKTVTKRASTNKKPAAKKTATKAVKPKAPKAEKEAVKAAPEKEAKKGFDYEHGEVLLELKHLKQYFRFKGGLTKYLKGVHDVSFKVYRGEVFGLVGESGCGKTTTGRDILKLYKVTSGDIWLEGTRIAAGTRWNEKEIKFTNIRAKAAVAKLRDEEEEIRKEFTSSVAEKVFTEKISFRKAAAMAEGDPAIDALLQKCNAKIEEKEKEIASVLEHAKAVTKEQTEKIKAAKRDDKNYNKNLAAAAVKKVEEKYASFLKDYEGKATKTPEDEKIHAAYEAELKAAKKTSLANKVQMIFQDPIASLNPRMTVRNIIAEGLIIQGVHDNAYIDEQVAKVLTMVGLVPEHANRYPHEFSGGQRQRIGIARAIIMNPELIVADEPVSALDVSVQAQVINLLNDLRERLSLTLIFIAHNLSVVKYFCDRIAVMYYGNLVELTTSDELFSHPLHPYTKSLLSAVPYPDPIVEESRKRITYVPERDHDYSKQKPTWRELVPGHFVSCNDEEAARYLEELKK